MRGDRRRRRVRVPGAPLDGGEAERDARRRRRLLARDDDHVVRRRLLAALEQQGQLRQKAAVDLGLRRRNVRRHRPEQGRQIALGETLVHVPREEPDLDERPRVRVERSATDESRAHQHIGRSSGRRRRRRTLLRRGGGRSGRGREKGLDPGAGRDGAGSGSARRAGARPWPRHRPHLPDRLEEQGRVVGVGRQRSKGGHACLEGVAGGRTSGRR
jgi:hypothetical protein